jgi:hypothetical protein
MALHVNLFFGAIPFEPAPYPATRGVQNALRFESRQAKEGLEPSTGAAEKV